MKTTANLSVTIPGAISVCVWNDIKEGEIPNGMRLKGFMAVHVTSWKATGFENGEGSTIIETTVWVSDGGRFELNCTVVEFEQLLAEALSFA